MRLKELVMLVVEIALFLVLVLWMMAETRGDVRRGNDVRDYFDKVEVNHVYNEWGCPKWTQLIFWDWSIYHKQYVVQAFFMLDNKECREHTKEGKDAWDKRVEDWARHFDVADQKRMRDMVSYNGDYKITAKHPQVLNGSYVSIILDKDGVSRVVTCRMMRETHTMYDVEMERRKFRPSRLRRGLTKKVGE